MTSLAVVPDVGPTDLQITGSAKQVPKSTPGLTQYTFQVRNNGRWGVSNATVTIDSPIAFDGAVPMSASNNGKPFAGYNCAMQTPTRAVCSFVSFAKSNFNLVAWVQLPVGTKATLTGSVTSTVTDSKPSDNTVRVSN